MIPLQFKAETVSGIYLHIPFCRQACHYCDFHFSTNLKNVDQLIDAITKEISLRKDYLRDHKIETIYFGGGTPSILKAPLIEQILDEISKNFVVSESVEVTLEANPEDVSRDAIKAWKGMGINRLSIGIQTFDEKKLAFINRSHNAKQATEAMELIASHFENFNADLIYAIPPEEMGTWTSDLEKLLAYNPPHVSLYGLTIEEKTVFGKWLEKGKIEEVSENENADEYQKAIEVLESHGFIHYEISNFCKPDNYSKHNTSYWKGAKYLGVGPGAHSYDGNSRSWNIRNNPRYIENINRGLSYYTEEILSLIDKQNEYLLTRLRNIWGIDLKVFQELFKNNFMAINPSYIDQLISNQFAIIEDDHFHLTKKGWFIADEILERLVVAS
ncbi:MAG: radical SAM family heme chaperone HemW [Bacteroidota bacterium]